MSSTTSTTERLIYNVNASANFGNYENSQMQNIDDDDLDVSNNMYDNVILYEASTRECLNLDIKKQIGDSSNDRREYEAAKLAKGIPSPPVIGDLTGRTIDALPEEVKEWLIPKYLLGNYKFSPRSLEANEMVDVTIDDGTTMTGTTKRVVRGVDEISNCGTRALQVCPEADKKMFKKWLDDMPKFFEQRSTSGLEGEHLVQTECDNADRMRVMLHTKDMIDNIIKVSNTTHALKQFRPVLANYNDIKEEAELASKYEDYLLLEEDADELVEKIANSSGKREGKARAAHTVKVKEIAKMKNLIETKVSWILRKKGMPVEELKATLLQLMKEKEGDDYELGWFPTIRDVMNSSSRQARTPSRNSLGKRNRDGASSEDESPEKKCRTGKKFPRRVTPGSSHLLKDYFSKTNEALTFTYGKDGEFEQAGGEWNEDAVRKLNFLQEETA